MLFLSHSPLFLQASRDQYCVHKTVSKSKNVTEECNKLLAEPSLSCEFFHKASKLRAHMAASANLQVSRAFGFRD